MIQPNTGYSPPIKGHRSTDGSRCFCRYTVYDNRTDFPIIVDGTAAECAKAMGITRSSFYCLFVKIRKGLVKRYTILRRMVDAPDEGEE